mgnify:CR=1 FL=1
MEIYHAGETLYLPPELESVARRVQESFEEENPREGIVQEYLERLLPEDWDTMDLPARRLWLEGTQEGTVRRRTVCTMEIWAEALGGCPDRLDRYDGKATIRPYGRQRYYERRQEA